jgi:hypothetical protein
VILVDTSVWVDHFRTGNTRLAQLLEATEVLSHPFVTGELACGTLHARREILELLEHLPAAHLVSHAEALHFLEAHALQGRGLGWVDVHLLAAAAVSHASLWTLDRRLAKAASTVLR